MLNKEELSKLTVSELVDKLINSSDVNSKLKSEKDQLEIELKTYKSEIEKYKQAEIAAQEAQAKIEQAAKEAEEKRQRELEIEAEVKKRLAEQNPSVQGIQILDPPPVIETVAQTQEQKPETKELSEEAKRAIQNLNI